MRRRRSASIASLATIVALSLLAAGCGGGAPGVADIASSTVPSTTASTGATDGASALLLAGRCLRQNGLSNFPDPSIASSGPAEGQAILDKGALRSFPNAVVTHAMAACSAELERAGIGGGSSARTPQDLQYLLAFARCVRSHGISDFPDPNSQGQVDLAGTGINKNALTPAQLAAVRACLPAAHGAIHIPAQDTNTSGGQ